MEQWQILLVVFPTVAALIGWFTNYVAIKLLFRPYDPVAILGVKFQGVLPKHFGEYAEKTAEMVAGDFLDTEALVREVDPLKFMEKSRPLFDEFFAEAVEEVKADLPEDNQLVKMLNPKMVEDLKREIWSQMQKEAPGAMEKVVEQANDLVDMKAFVTDVTLKLGPKGLEDIIYRVSGWQLKWIEYLGAVYGTVLGFLQFGFVQVLPQADEGQVGIVIKLAMPLFGCIVGLVTNWFAIQMMWYPRERRGWWIFSWQGMFPSKQEQIQQQMIQITAEELIFPSDIFALLSDKLDPETIEKDLLEQRDTVLPEKFPGLKNMLDQFLSRDQQDSLIRILAAKFGSYHPKIKDLIVDYADNHVDVTKILQKKADELDKEAFENYLRDIYSKEETWLVIYGGILGAMMGGAQLGVYILTYAWQHKDELQKVLDGAVSMLF